VIPPIVVERIGQQDVPGENGKCIQGCVVVVFVFKNKRIQRCPGRQNGRLWYQILVVVLVVLNIQQQYCPLLFGTVVGLLGLTRYYY